MISNTLILPAEEYTKANWISLLPRWPACVEPAAVCFALLWLFIAFVSVHDGYLVALNSPVMLEAEQNPVGRFLIQQNGGEVWLFLLVKATGTAVVCTSLLALYQWVRRLALAIVGPVACFQFTLLLYLSLR